MAEESVGVELSAEETMVHEVAGVEVSAAGSVASASALVPTVNGVQSIEQGRLTPPNAPAVRAATADKEEGEDSATTNSSLEVIKEGFRKPEVNATSAPMPSPKARSPSPSIQTRECDYDRDPSPLYKAVETKDWDRVLELAEDNPLLASTWVLRKEKDGQLRWRLLPLHAAIIFQAPYTVIETLLTSFPQSAMCKDDQGMLPLHLAFRNHPIQFDIVEELLTAHPAAVYVQDRKGRTPLQGGLVATGGKDKNPALSVLELYTQIAAAGEKQRWLLAHDREAQQRMEAAQQQFGAEKAALQDIHKKALQHANEQHVQEVVKLKEQVNELEEANKTLKEQKIELEQQKTTGLLSSSASMGIEETKKERRWRLQAENEALQEMVQLLLAQQASLRQSLERQEEVAVEQEAARQKIWQDLITQQHETRTAVRKSTSVWIDELKTTETSITTAIKSIRQAAELKRNRDRTASGVSSGRSTPTTPTRDLLTEEKKEDSSTGGNLEMD